MFGSMYKNIVAKWAKLSDCKAGNMCKVSFVEWHVSKV
jgi:hypothetical protein